jgi:peptidoglycan-associated lipoprotein
MEGIHMRKAACTLVLILASLATASCSKDAPPPEVAPAEPAEPEPAPAEQEKPGDNPAQSDINISDEIKRACGLTDTEARFAYNSANVREADRAVMKKLADCFTIGKLKGRTMQLAGHADPRGEPEYNLVLGGRRADNVATALKKEGLPAAQVTTTSRGEMEARGTDEASWAKDRRVDIHLAAAE